MARRLYELDPLNDIISQMFDEYLAVPCKFVREPLTSVHRIILGVIAPTEPLLHPYVLVC